jgi:hypothetical protein
MVMMMAVITIWKLLEGSMLYKKQDCKEMAATELLEKLDEFLNMDIFE